MKSFKDLLEDITSDKDIYHATFGSNKEKRSWLKSASDDEKNKFDNIISKKAGREDRGYSGQQRGVKGKGSNRNSFDVLSRNKNKNSNAMKRNRDVSNRIDREEQKDSSHQRIHDWMKSINANTRYYKDKSHDENYHNRNYHYALTNTIERGLKKDGYIRTHASKGDDGRITSRYLQHPDTGKKLRISEHEIEPAPHKGREHSSMGGADGEIVTHHIPVGTSHHELMKASEHAMNGNDLKDYFSKDGEDIDTVLKRHHD